MSNMIEPYAIPVVAWVKSRMSQEKRPTIVCCSTLATVVAVAEDLSDAGNVVTITGQTPRSDFLAALRPGEEDNPTIIVATKGRILTGFMVQWPKAYVTAATKLNVADAVQLMGRPRDALNQRTLTAYFPVLAPAFGWVDIAGYVNNEVHGMLRPYQFDSMVDKDFSFNMPRGETQS